MDDAEPQGTLAGRSWIVAWRHLHRTGGGSGRRGGCRNLPSGSPGPDGRMAAGLLLGEGKGLEFNAAAEAARAPDPRDSRLGRRRAACPGPVICCPGAKGPRRGPRSIVQGVLQVAGLELPARTGRPAGPWAVTLFFCLPFSRQPETRHRRPAWPLLWPACRSPYLQLISESLGPAMRPGAEVLV